MVGFGGGVCGGLIYGNCIPNLYRSRVTYIALYCSVLVRRVWQCDAISCVYGGSRHPAKVTHDVMYDL